MNNNMAGRDSEDQQFHKRSYHNRNRLSQAQNRLYQEMGVHDLREVLDRKRTEQDYVTEDNVPPPDPAYSYLTDSTRGNNYNERKQNSSAQSSPRRNNTKESKRDINNFNNRDPKTAENSYIGNDNNRDPRSSRNRDFEHGSRAPRAAKNKDIEHDDWGHAQRGPRPFKNRFSEHDDRDPRPARDYEPGHKDPRFNNRDIDIEHAHRDPRRVKTKDNNDPRVSENIDVEHGHTNPRSRFAKNEDIGDLGDVKIEVHQGDPRPGRNKTFGKSNPRNSRNRDIENPYNIIVNCSISTGEHVYKLDKDNTLPTIKHIPDLIIPQKSFRGRGRGRSFQPRNSRNNYNEGESHFNVALDENHLEEIPEQSQKDKKIDPSEEKDIALNEAQNYDLQEQDISKQFHPEDVDHFNPDLETQIQELKMEDSAKLKGNAQDDSEKKGFNKNADGDLDLNTQHTKSSQIAEASDK